MRGSDRLRVAGIILAAGASTRLGEPKQNIRLGTETLLERTIRTAEEADLDPVFVVVTPEIAHALNTRGRVLLNEGASEGMASSIRIGVAAAVAELADSAIILACDQPFVTAEHLRLLANGNGEIIASTYAGRKGVPAYFPAKEFMNLLELRGDTGAREMLREARTIALNKGELDIDTAEDLKRTRELNAFDPQ